MKTNLVTLAAFALAASLSTFAQAQTEIQWWHSMTAVNGEWVNDLAKEFNASQKDYKIVPHVQGHLRRIDDECDCRLPGRQRAAHPAGV